ncbi:hypothetical protein [uncultured Demequina sp.]|uniref:hypothetical protein n=1 Tax=uncultured Demequina sp. TaxID=693499 RepID=UPI0025FF88BD|nr:hypothetical protein [uncultured Demequina sp.]
MSTSQRLTRAALAAAVSTFVALASHVLGGGSSPSAAGVVVPLVLSFAICMQLAGKALSLWRLGIAVTASQALFHTLFVLGSGGTVVSGGGHSHHGGDLTVTAMDTAAHGAHGGGLMTAAHIAAAILTTAALHRAEWLLERASRGLAWLAARLLPQALPTASPVVTSVRMPARASAPVSVRDVARGVRSLRGPPVLSA